MVGFLYIRGLVVLCSAYYLQITLLKTSGYKVCKLLQLSWIKRLSRTLTAYLVWAIVPLINCIIMVANISPKEFMLFLCLVTHVCFTTIYLNGSPYIAKSVHLPQPKIQHKFQGDIRSNQEGLDPGAGYFSRINGQYLKQTLQNILVKFWPGLLLLISQSFYLSQPVNLGHN